MLERITVILSALGTINLLLLSVISWVKSRKMSAYFWLGWIFFPVSLAIANNVSIFLGHGNIVFYHISLLFNVSWGGYLYFFIKSLQNPEERSVFFDWRFLIPSLLYVPYIILTIVEPAWGFDTIKKAETGQMNVFGMFYNFVICLYAISINIILLLGEYRRKPIAIESIKKALSERKEMLWVMLVLQLMAFVPFLLKLNLNYIILYMPVFGQIFFMYMFFRMSQSTTALIYESHRNESGMLIPIPKNQSTIKYASIHLEQDKIEIIYSRILHFMESEKPFLRMDFSLIQMSKQLNILPNILSMVINSKSNTNFSDFINSYRIRVAIDLLKNLEKSKSTIENIAYDSGFSNRTSFYNAFRKYTNKLPSEFVKEQRNKELLVG
jgi:AraC-like DNA-binding protein